MAQGVRGAGRWPRRLSLAAAAAYGGGPLLAHVNLLPAMAGFLLFGIGGALGVIATIAGVLAFIRRAGALALLGSIPGAVVAIWFIVTAAGAGEYPRINDITTDVARPPRFVHAPSLSANQDRDMAYPGEVFARQQLTGYPGLAGLSLPVPPEEAYQRVLRAARTMPAWQITREDAEAHALEGVDTTWLFHFHDDFVIEVRPREGSSTVEMRSKSRDGKGDIGANAKRIRAFFDRVMASG